MMKTILWLVAMVGLATGCATHSSAPPVAEHSPYYRPLMSPGAKFSAAPPAVQRTIRAEAGLGPISDIRKYRAHDETVYGVFFENPGVFPPLFIAPDGSVLNLDLTTAVGGVGPEEVSGVLTGGPVTSISLNELPPKAVQAIQSSAADAEIDTITKDTHGDKVEYVVTFKGHRHLPLHLNEQGVLSK